MDDAMNGPHVRAGSRRKDAMANNQTSNGQSASIPPPTDPEQLTAPQCQARAIRDGVIPTLMQAATAWDGLIDGYTLKGYRDELLREIGSPIHPLERMLIEQAALGHLMTMKFHVSTVTEKTPEGAGVYAAAAVRLMAELRRTIEAARKFRAPLTRSIITKSEKHNVALTQPVSYVAGPEGNPSTTMTCRDKTDVDSKQGNNLEVMGHERDDTSEISSPRGQWTAKPTIAETAHDVGRQRLGEKALANRQWECSKGPRTAKGKAAVAEKGRKRPNGQISVRERQAAVAEARNLCAEMAALRGAVASNATCNGSGDASGRP